METIRKCFPHSLAPKSSAKKMDLSKPSYLLVSTLLFDDHITDRTVVYDNSTTATVVQDPNVDRMARSPIGPTFSKASQRNLLHSFQAISPPTSPSKNPQQGLRSPQKSDSNKTSSQSLEYRDELEKLKRFVLV